MGKSTAQRTEEIFTAHLTLWFWVWFSTLVVWALVGTLSTIPELPFLIGYPYGAFGLLSIVIIFLSCASVYGISSIWIGKTKNRRLYPTIWSIARSGRLGVAFMPVFWPLLGPLATVLPIPGPIVLSLILLPPLLMMIAQCFVKPTLDWLNKQPLSDSTVKRFVWLGADINQCFIYHADKPGLNQWLLNQGADIHAANHQGDTAFLSTVKKQKSGILTQAQTIATIRFLMAHGANLNTVCRFGAAFNKPRTLLSWAIQNEMDEVAEFLVQEDANMQDIDHNALLQILAKNGYIEAIRTLHKQNNNTKRCYDYSEAAAQAAACGHAEVVAMLLDYGADPTKADANGLTAFEHAVVNAHAKVVKLLYDHAKPDKIPGILAKAIKNKTWGVVEIFVLKGATTDFDEAGLDQVLGPMASMGSTEAVKMILDQGANPSGIQRFSATSHETPLSACLKAVARAKGASGPDVQEKISYQPIPMNSPVIMATRNGHAEVVDLLCKRGALVDCQDTTGTPALIIAGVRGYLEVFRVLLKHGANPEASGPDYKIVLTRILEVISDGETRTAMVNELVQYGAVPMKSNLPPKNYESGKQGYWDSTLRSTYHAKKRYCLTIFATESAAKWRVSRYRYEDKPLSDLSLHRWILLAVMLNYCDGFQYSRSGKQIGGFPPEMVLTLKLCISLEKQERKENHGWVTVEEQIIPNLTAS